MANNFQNFQLPNTQSPNQQNSQAQLNNMMLPNYQQNTIPLESREGLELIDKWVDKWGYIIRSLKKKTKNISSDLSGGFDTRSMITILMNSGIDLNQIYIHSINDKI